MIGHSLVRLVGCAISLVIACGVDAAAHAGPPPYSNTHNFNPVDGASNSAAFFGYKVDVADTKLVVGDPYFLDEATNAVGGFAVFRFESQVNEWRFEQHVGAPNEFRACSYQDVSTDGSRIAAIADDATSSSIRHVLVYVFGPSGWTLEDVISPPLRPSSVNIEGDTLLVGSWRTDAGAAYIYGRRAEGKWMLDATLDGPGPSPAPLGIDCDLHADLAVVAGYADAFNGYGAVVYRLDRALGTWALEQTIRAAPPFTGLGWSVSTDGSRIAIGNRMAGGGAVVFAYDPVKPAEPWRHEATIGVPVGGSRVIPDDVSVHAGMLVVSNRWGGPDRQGRVHCYRFESGEWILESSLVRPNGEQELDQFGGSVGQFETTVVVGNFVYGDRAQASVFVRESEVEGPPLPAPPACPVITRHPSGRPGVQGEDLMLSVEALGAPPLTYQWQLDGVDLVDGISHGGGQISGATSAHMALHGAATLDSGFYSIRVTGSCDSVQSISRYIRIYCPADINRDGEVGSTDFFDFLMGFFSQNSGGDFDRNGTIDSQDFFLFVAAFFDAC